LRHEALLGRRAPVRPPFRTIRQGLRSEEFPKGRAEGLAGEVNGLDFQGGEVGGVPARVKPGNKVVHLPDAMLSLPSFRVLSGDAENLKLGYRNDPDSWPERLSADLGEKRPVLSEPDRADNGQRVSVGEGTDPQRVCCPALGAGGVPEGTPSPRLMFPRSRCIIFDGVAEGFAYSIGPHDDLAQDDRDFGKGCQRRMRAPTKPIPVSGGKDLVGPLCP